MLALVVPDVLFAGGITNQKTEPVSLRPYYARRHGF
jgi:hypothetical protein